MPDKPMICRYGTCHIAAPLIDVAQVSIRTGVAGVDFDRAQEGGNSLFVTIHFDKHHPDIVGMFGIVRCERGGHPVCVKGWLELAQFAHDSTESSIECGSLGKDRDSGFIHRSSPIEVSCRFQRFSSPEYGFEVSRGSPQESSAFGQDLFPILEGAGSGHDSKPRGYPIWKQGRFLPVVAARFLISAYADEEVGKREVPFVRVIPERGRECRLRLFVVSQFLIACSRQLEGPEIEGAVPECFFGGPLYGWPVLSVPGFNRVCIVCVKTPPL
jgi:hypothetical protein